MPQYVYDCTKCSKEKTELRPIADMDKEKPCEVEGCDGTMKKRFVLGRVIGVRNVPNN